MKLYTPSSPHVHAQSSVTKVMLKVLYALLPGIAIYLFLFGWGVLINIILAVCAGLVAEALMLKIRQRPMLPFLTDGSVVLTAVLLALSIPPIAPWWIPVLGVVFAVVIAKHLYGGLGYNPFNPAMVGYAMLIISFPREMTSWMAPKSLTDSELNFADSWGVIFQNSEALKNIDAISSATPLDYMKSQLGLDHTVAEIVQGSPIFGGIGGVGYEWVALAFLLGGVWLIQQKIIQWQIPIAMLSALFLIAGVFHLLWPEQYASPLFHLMVGATMLGAFFIATDPVTASVTPLGKIIYGAGIGLLIYIIRMWGGFPDAIAFAVLFMNMCAPAIDYYTKPKVYGQRNE